MTSFNLTYFYERADRKDKEVQRKILALPGSRRDLDTLVKAGANEKEVLELLSFTVTDRGFWRKAMRRKKKELVSIANQLETVANYAQRVSLDPSSYGTLWLAVLGLDKWENAKPAKELTPMYIFGLMRLYAKDCRDKAKAFGDLLRTQPRREKREMIDCLLLHVWHTTRKYHDQELAHLLTDAFEAVGKKKQFTVDQIKKHRQRYVVPRIKLYQKRTLAGPNRSRR